MRLAVLSDIHGNLDAFQEVLADIEQVGVDHIFCLGDMVGYGPEPEECLELVREREIPCILGNHEMGILSPKTLKWFNPTARESIEKTRDMLSASSRLWLQTLPLFRIYETIRFVHGFPPDSPFLYLFQVPRDGLIRSFATLSETICLVGHTHVMRLIRFDGVEPVTTRIGPGLISLGESNKYIINAGSVGQPREGTISAGYLLLDTGQGTLEARMIPYDSSRTAEKILRLGLPAVHAERLRPR